MQLDTMDLIVRYPVHMLTVGTVTLRQVHVRAVNLDTKVSVVTQVSCIEYHCMVYVTDVNRDAKNSIFIYSVLFVIQDKALSKCICHYVILTVLENANIVNCLLLTKTSCSTHLSLILILELSSFFSAIQDVIFVLDFINGYI